MLGLTRYQWLVLFAAWLGWGFDVFDGLLFNFVAPICVPDLLGLDPSDPKAKEATFVWTAGLTSMLLLGWALGGIVFGKITDRLGRTRTLLITILTYALATAACAFAPNIWVLAFFRLIASFGIGGEWAAGASLVAETVPPKKRVLAGALLYTSAPMGLLLATYVNDLLTRQVEVLAHDPSRSWRAVFLTGLVPAAIAIVIRLKVKEPEAWKPDVQPRIAELFTPELRRRTLGGLAMALVALITWWSCSAFIPVVSSMLARSEGLGAAAFAMKKTAYITHGTVAFALGGLVGTLLTVPVAVRMGRRRMYIVYYLASAAALILTYAPDWPPAVRLTLFFTVGVTVFGVFGSFTFYLPELFPTRLRGTGAGFTYNIGRIITAAFPFAVGESARRGIDPLVIMSSVAAVPVLGVLLVLRGVGVETKGEDAGEAATE